MPIAYRLGIFIRQFFVPEARVGANLAYILTKQRNRFGWLRQRQATTFAVSELGEVVHFTARTFDRFGLRRLTTTAIRVTRPTHDYLRSCVTGSLQPASFVLDFRT